MNQLDLVQAVDRFCQDIVVAIVFADHRELDARFGYAFAAAGRHNPSAPTH